MRGQARDYDHWARHRRRRLELARVPAGLHEARRLSQGRRRRARRARLRPQGERRAASGASRSSACAGTCSTPLPQAAQQAGIPHSDDFNRGDNEGVGYFEVNQRRGIRWNAAKAFLRPVRAAATTCRSGPARRSRACCSTRRRRSARHRRRGAAARRRRADPGAARRGEVILAAGAVGTPQILQLSGIGAGRLLQQHGIARAARPAGRGRATCRTICRSARSSACRA